jgi:hypothetical protein
MVLGTANIATTGYANPKRPGCGVLPHGRVNSLGLDWQRRTLKTTMVGGGTGGGWQDRNAIPERLSSARRMGLWAEEVKARIGARLRSTAAANTISRSPTDTTVRLHDPISGYVGSIKPL